MTTNSPQIQTTVTDALRTDILAGRFEPGDRLLEVALSEHYAVGRAAVRSALVELATEGLVLRETNRGAVVRRISIDEAIQINEARAVLEGLIAARAASSATAADRTELAGIIDQMRSAVGEDRAADYSTLNSVLHRRLREMSGHLVAAELVDNLRNRAAHHQYRLALMPGRPGQSLEQHAAIVDAVIAGDAEAAGEAMHAHLASVIDVLRRWGDAPGFR